MHFSARATGHIATWNPGAQHIKGYKAEEIIRQHFSVFYTEEDRRVELPKRALAEARGKGRFETEGWRVRKDGTKFWASIRGFPFQSQLRATNAVAN
jgi:PAS domain S-box-containing protein